MDQKNIEKIEISKINDINKICDCQIVYSIKEKEEVMKNNNIGIIKVTNKKKTPSGPTTPAWFKEWYKQFKKENDARWERQEKINNSLLELFKEFKKENDARWERQEKINNSLLELFKEFKKENDQRWKEQFEFNKMIISRLDKIDQRIDNLVKKNNLIE